jgi:hypothetical protein
LDVRSALIPGVIEGLSFSSDVKVWEFLPREILSAEWLAQCHLPITEVLVFQRDSTKADTAAHIDHAENRELNLEDWNYLPAAVNWCVGEDHKPMHLAGQGDTAYGGSGDAGIGKNAADGFLAGVPPILRALLGPQRPFHAHLFVRRRSGGNDCTCSQSFGLALMYSSIFAFTAGFSFGGD